MSEFLWVVPFLVAMVVGMMLLVAIVVAAIYSSKIRSLNDDWYMERRRLEDKLEDAERAASVRRVRVWDAADAVRNMVEEFRSESDHTFMATMIHKATKTTDSNAMSEVRYFFAIVNALVDYLKISEHDLPTHFWARAYHLIGGERTTLKKYFGKRLEEHSKIVKDSKAT